jgi:DNA-binding MarR family transcriptional regulator
MPSHRKRGDSAATQDRESITSIVDSLRVIVKALRASGREAERQLGISGAQLHILQELQDRPAQSINQLAARTYTHQSSVSTVVAKLTRNHLVTRSHSPADARKVVISLTSAGKGMLRRSPTTAQGRIVTALRSMRGTELRDLSQTLGTLARLLRESDSVSVPRKDDRVALEA